MGILPIGERAGVEMERVVVLVVVAYHIEELGDGVEVVGRRRTHLPFPLALLLVRTPPVLLLPLLPPPRHLLLLPCPFHIIIIITIIIIIFSHRRCEVVERYHQRRAPRRHPLRWEGRALLWRTIFLVAQTPPGPLLLHLVSQVLHSPMEVLSDSTCRRRRPPRRRSLLAHSPGRPHAPCHRHPCPPRIPLRLRQGHRGPRGEASVAVEYVVPIEVEEVEIRVSKRNPFDHLTPRRAIMQPKKMQCRRREEGGDQLLHRHRPRRPRGREWAPLLPNHLIHRTAPHHPHHRLRHRRRRPPPTRCEVDAGVAVALAEEDEAALVDDQKSPVTLVLFLRVARRRLPIP